MPVELNKDTQDLGAARTAAARRGMLFGIPLGELGWFQSLLMGTAAGMLAFFLTTFVAIMTILVLNTAAHQTIDFAVSYRDIGLPVGLLVLVMLAYMLSRLPVGPPQDLHTLMVPRRRSWPQAGQGPVIAAIEGVGEEAEPRRYRLTVFL